MGRYVQSVQEVVQGIVLAFGERDLGSFIESALNVDHAPPPEHDCHENFCQYDTR